MAGMQVTLSREAGSNSIFTTWQMISFPLGFFQHAVIATCSGLYLSCFRIQEALQRGMLATGAQEGVMTRA